MSNHTITESTKRVDYEVAAPGGEYAIELTLYNSDDDIDIRCNTGGHLVVMACDIESMIALLITCRARWIKEYGEDEMARLTKSMADQKAEKEVHTAISIHQSPGAKDAP